MTSTGDDARSNPARLLVAVVASLGAAAAVGTAAGAAAYQLQQGPADGQWDELGDALVALAAGVAAGGLTYVIGITIVVRTCVVAGRRLGTAATIVAATAAVPILVGWASESASRGGASVLALPLALSVLALALTAVGVASGSLRPGALARIGAVAATGLVVVTSLAAVRGEQVADDRRAARYDDSGVPLALVGGRDLAVPAVGWELVSISQGWSPDDVTVTFDAPSLTGSFRSAWVVLVMERAPDPARCGAEPGDAEACVNLGRRDDGAEILGLPITGYGSTTGFHEIWVDVPGGRWSISGTSSPQPVDVDAAVAILTSLEIVDADTFAAAT